MANYNMDNIERSLEEDLLLDLIESPVNLLIEGVDSAVDLDAQNYRIKAFNQKIDAISALIYLKESTILTVRKEDAVRGSIFFNQETNSIEYFDGQSWKSNIFGPNTILDSNSIPMENFGKNIDQNGISFATVTDFFLNMSINENQVLFILIDGELLDKSLFYIDEKNDRRVIFTAPFTVYSNLSYYVLGSENKFTGTIPKYETVEYVSDGIKTNYAISLNSDFIVTYKSSIMVIVDGKVLRDSEFELNTRKTHVILKNVPPLGHNIVIKTLYGIVTDFRTSLSYVEQIQEATIDKQQTFKYNGVSEAIKVYWNGLRLVSLKDYKFNYVQKLVIFEKHIVDQIKKGDTVIIEKEMAPLSKEPMQGVIETERLKADVNGSMQLKKDCNGITNIIAVNEKSKNQTVLNSEDYFLTDNIVTITKHDLLNDDKIVFHISYLSNAVILDNMYPTIDDKNTSSIDKTWSARKLNLEFNGKANRSGTPGQDFNVGNLEATNNINGSGNLSIINKAVIGNGIHIKDGEFVVGQSEQNYRLRSSDVTFLINQDVNMSKNLLIQGNLEVLGNYVGKKLSSMEVTDNKVKLNSNLTENDNPVPESGLFVNRGKLGEAKIVFDETSTKWSVNKNEDGDALIPISLEGHKHTVEDFIGTVFGLPNYHAIFSDKNTEDSFYDDEENYKKYLNDLLDENKQNTSISRLNIKKSALIDEAETDEVKSGTILSFERYAGKFNKTGTNDISKEDLFAIIEDGSVISNSLGSLKVPSGPSNKRWESDNEFCGIKNKKFNSKLESLKDFENINGLIRYNTDLKCLEVKVDGIWIQFFKPDRKYNGIKETKFGTGRFVIDFDKDDFHPLQADAKLNYENFGLSINEMVFKINHNLNSLFVRVDIFDDKRTSYPLLYKCIDENNVYVTFPSNISDLSNSNEIEDWLKFLADSLHTVQNVEGNLTVL